MPGGGQLIHLQLIENKHIDCDYLYMSMAFSLKVMAIISINYYWYWYRACLFLGLFKVMTLMQLSVVSLFELQIINSLYSSFWCKDRI